MIEGLNYHEITTHLEGFKSLGLLLFAAFTVEQRRAAFKRAKGKCEDCGKSFYDGWVLNIHHLRPLHLGGKDELSNAWCCCVEDHAQRHKELYDQLGKPADYSAWKSLSGSEKRTRRWLGKSKRGWL